MPIITPSSVVLHTKERLATKYGTSIWKLGEEVMRNHREGHGSADFIDDLTIDTAKRAGITL